MAVRRLAQASVCIIAVAAGFLVPVLAFGDGGAGGASAPAQGTTKASADLGGVDPERMLHLLAGLMALAVSPGSSTTASTVSASVPAPTTTTQTATVTAGSTPTVTTTVDAGSTESTADVPTSSTATTTESAPVGGTTAPTAGTTTASTTAGTTTADVTTTGSTTTTGTTTGSTTTSGGDSGGGGKHQRRSEWIAALLAAALLGTALFLIDRALIAQRQESTKHAAPGWYPASFLEHPVPRFLLLGEDGRWATSKTLASVWTVVLVWAISTIALSDLFGAADGWNAFKDQAVSWQYLLLLGGPVGAAIGTQALTLIRSQSGAEVKTAPPEGASFSQLYTDDWGKLDLIDVQYLTFNVLSILVFLVVFVADASAGLPVFPGVLATLTAATAAAYLARRAALRADPVITSIAPPAAAPGEFVRMWGVNLTPAKEAKSVEGLDEEERKRVAEEEAERASIDVFFDGVRAASVKPAGTQASDLSEAYVVQVPAGAAVKDGVQVIVNSRGIRGHKSAPYTDFKVVGPVLTSVSPPLASAGKKITIWGTKLLVGGGEVTVFFDDLPGKIRDTHAGDDSSQDVIEVEVPELAAGTVKVRLIGEDGQASNQLDLRLAADVRIFDAPKVLSLGPDTKSLFIKGHGFITQPGPPLLAAVFLDGRPLAVKEGGWAPGEVTVQLPTSADDLAKLGFAAKDDAQLVVRSDQGHSSEPWPLKLEVAVPAKGN
jgi:hypothetical protein